jgi:transcriptional regulator with XRE-family HTH domain
MFVMCEQDGMAQTPGTQELADKAGISKSYASEILSGKRPTLGRPIAIHIFRKTGWRHESIADLSEEQMEMLEQIEPWAPRAAA